MGLYFVENIVTLHAELGLEWISDYRPTPEEVLNVVATLKAINNPNASRSWKDGAEWISQHSEQLPQVTTSPTIL